MKKILLSISALAAMSFSTASDASAQVIKGFYKQSYKSRNNGTFDKGTGIFSIGIGAPSHNHSFDPRLPALYLKYEKGLMNEVGLGFIGGLSFGRHGRSRDGAFNSLFGVLGYYHFNKIIPVRNLDVYAGAGVGLNIFNAYNWNDGDVRVNIIPLFKGGVRYYFTPSFGAFVESGYDRISSVNAGVTFRF